MKKQFLKSIILMTICIFLLSGCGVDHTGQAKTPSGSSVQKGRDYTAVQNDFTSAGFTNVKLEPIEDLILGWLTKDGEVEKVSVGGNEEYYPDTWVEAGTEVIIYFHTFPSKEDKSEEETVKNDIEETDEVVEDTVTEVDNTIENIAEEAEESEEAIEPTEESEEALEPTEESEDPIESSDSSDSNESAVATSGMDEDEAWDCMYSYIKNYFNYGVNIDAALGESTQLLEDEWWFSWPIKYENEYGNKVKATFKGVVVWDGGTEYKVDPTSVLIE